MIRLTLFPCFSVTSKQQELPLAEEPRLLTLGVQQVDPVMAMAREGVITTGVGGIPGEVSSSLMMAGDGNNSLQEAKEVIAGAGLLRTQETDTDKVE